MGHQHAISVAACGSLCSDNESGSSNATPNAYHELLQMPHYRPGRITFNENGNDHLSESRPCDTRKTQGSEMPTPVMSIHAKQQEDISPQADIFGPRANRALRDYQLQLMLLEQQNKKRHLMAQQAQQIMETTDEFSACQLHDINSPRDSGYGSCNPSPGQFAPAQSSEVYQERTLEDRRTFDQPRLISDAMREEKDIPDLIPHHDSSTEYTGVARPVSAAISMKLDKHDERHVHVNEPGVKQGPPPQAIARSTMEVIDKYKDHESLDTTSPEELSEDTSSQSDDSRYSQPPSAEKCNHILLTRAKHDLIVSVMRDVYVMLYPDTDVGVREHAVCEERDSNTSRISTGSPENGERRSSQRRKRDDGTPPPGDGDNDDNRKRARRSSSKVVIEDNQLTYACPFHKYDALKYRSSPESGSMYRTCMGPGFKTISRVK